MSDQRSKIENVIKKSIISSGTTTASADSLDGPSRLKKQSTPDQNENFKRINNLIFQRMARHLKGQRHPSYLGVVNNHPRKTFCHRSVYGWAIFLVSYFIYIGILIGFCAALFSIWFAKAGRLPIRTGEKSSIGLKPNVIVMAPKIKDESNMLVFDHRNARSWLSYVRDLRKIMIDYHNIEPNGNTLFNCSTEEGSFERSLKDSRSCVPSFVRSGNADTGFGDCFCNKEVCKSFNFGYDENKPCLMISLGKLVGWTPGDAPAATASNNLRIFDCRKDSVMFSCGIIAKNMSRQHSPTNNVSIELKVFPVQGIPFCYYPYYNLPGYVQPFVMLQVVNPNQVHVKCKANKTTSIMLPPYGINPLTFVIDSR